MIELGDKDKFTNSNKYEYSIVKLKDTESKYIYIPLSIITNIELDTKRVGVFSYLRIHCGLNNVIGFTIPDMVEWCGMKPNNRPDKSNDKFLSIVDDFNDMGYLTYLNERNKSSYMKCKFDTDYYGQECSDGYAVVYLDEIEKIINYKNPNGSSVSNTTILLVFAYLRNKIRRRPNELKPEERSPEGIADRKKRLPEVYDSNIDTIADEINISSKTLLKAIDILEEELKLIVTDRAYRIKNNDGEFRTLPTLFANAYKREADYLLVTGEEYSRIEIGLKAEHMKQYYKGFKINETKRK